MSGNDALLAKLETFTDPGFDLTKHTINVVVSGTWYIAYEDVESTLSQARVLSPAVRMLNSLIITCLMKMPLLRTFVWDAQVTPTQRLISNLSNLPNLETVQLRLATDGTPNPYFHPLLRFQSFQKVASLNLVQIDKADILESIGNVLGVLPCLSELRICADVEAALSLETLFAKHPPAARFHLVTLDLRGFLAIQSDPRVFWGTLQSDILRNLTVEVCGPFDQKESRDFWAMASASGLQLSHLSTNLITSDITAFLNSFSGLRSLHLTFNSQLDAVQPFPAILEVISSRHSNTLEVLALLSQGIQNEEYLLPERTLEETAQSLPHLKEFSFAIDDEDIDNLSHVVNLPRLRTLHVRLDMNLNEDELNELTSQIRVSVSAAIEEQDSSSLEYFAINGGPLYRLTRNPLRWHIITNHLGRMPDTELFRDALDDWVERVR